jgi:hypothetical protein
MFYKPRSLLLAAGLMTVPFATVMAQSNPTANLGSNRSVTASPGTADSSSASAMTTGDAASRITTTNTYGGAKMTNATPGATGRSVVPGASSSQASAAPSTIREKTGSTSGGGSK